MVPYFEELEKDIKRIISLLETLVAAHNNQNYYPLETTEKNNRKAYTTKELAEVLGVSTWLIYMHLNEIPHRKVGGKLLFSKQLIDEWIKKGGLNQK